MGLLALDVTFPDEVHMGRMYLFARDDRRREKHVGRGKSSSSQDKGEGALDKAKGKAKEATGAVTGDEAKKSEGQKDQTKGTAKDKLGKAKDLLK